MLNLKPDTNLASSITFSAWVQNMLQEMLEEMEVQDIPAEYGGQLEGEVYNSREEKEFWEYVDALNADSAR